MDRKRLYRDVACRNINLHDLPKAPWLCFFWIRLFIVAVPLALVATCLEELHFCSSISHLDSVYGSREFIFLIFCRFASYHQVCPSPASNSVSTGAHLLNSFFACPSTVLKFLQVSKAYSYSPIAVILLSSSTGNRCGLCAAAAIDPDWAAASSTWNLASRTVGVFELKASFTFSIEGSSQNVYSYRKVRREVAGLLATCVVVHQVKWLWWTKQAEFNLCQARHERFGTHRGHSFQTNGCNGCHHQASTFFSLSANKTQRRWRLGLRDMSKALISDWILVKNANVSRSAKFELRTAAAALSSLWMIWFQRSQGPKRLCTVIVSLGFGLTVHLLWRLKGFLEDGFGRRRPSNQLGE